MCIDATRVCCQGAPAACHTMVSKRDVGLVTNIFYNNVIWYREVTLKVHGVLEGDILCRQHHHIKYAGHDSLLSRPSREKAQSCTLERVGLSLM